VTTQTKIKTKFKKTVLLTEPGQMNGDEIGIGKGAWDMTPI
jgi:hypothetical protein